MRLINSTCSLVLAGSTWLKQTRGAQPDNRLEGQSPEVKVSRQTNGANDKITWPIDSIPVSMAEEKRE